MNKKTFRPLSIPFIIIMGLINIIVIGLLCLIIIGFIEMNLLYIIVGILGFGFLAFENIKLLTWKIVFNDKYIFVPSSVFDRFMFGQKEIQKISYSEIEKSTLIKIPVPILFIQCRRKEKPNAIYVKQFTKKQVDDIMAEINSRIQNKNL